MTPLEIMALAYRAKKMGLPEDHPDVQKSYRSAVGLMRAALIALSEAEFKGPNLLTDEAFKARLRAIANEGKTDLCQATSEQADKPHRADGAPQVGALHFGQGTLVVDTGTFGDKLAVFIAPVDHSGEVGASAEHLGHPPDTLLAGEQVLTFPSMEQAQTVADALVGSISGGRSKSDSEVRMEIKQGKTQRGFRVDEFVDLYGAECSLQESSLATESAIWFGCSKLGLEKFTPGKGWKDIELENDPHGIHHVANTRMHLNQEMVKALLPALLYFAEFGELPEDLSEGRLKEDPGETSHETK